MFQIWNIILCIYFSPVLRRIERIKCIIYFTYVYHYHIQFNKLLLDFIKKTKKQKHKAYCRRVNVNNRLNKLMLHSFIQLCIYFDDAPSTMKRRPTQINYTYLRTSCTAWKRNRVAVAQFDLFERIDDAERASPRPPRFTYVNYISLFIFFPSS